MIITPQLIQFIRANIITFIIFVIVYYIYRVYRIKHIQHVLSTYPKYKNDYNKLPKHIKYTVAQIKYDYQCWNLDELLYGW